MSDHYQHENEIEAMVTFAISARDAWKRGEVDLAFRYAGGALTIAGRLAENVGATLMRLRKMGEGNKGDE